MALSHSPSIVTDGLVLCLDAANRKSYPGTGTVWNNMVGNVGATFQNGPTFNSSNLGTVSFDGTDDQIPFFAPNLSSVATVEMWAKIGDNWTSGRMFFGWNLYDVWTGNFSSIGFNTANGDVYGIPSATLTPLNIVNNWKHYVFVMRTDVSYTNNKIYINGQSFSLSQIQSGENGGARSFNSGNGQIGNWLATSGYNMQMDCSIFNVYNKELSPQEVVQNFNALRGRFGI
jgi:hypothetical protein